MGGPYMYHQFPLYLPGLVVWTSYVPYMLDTLFLCDWNLQRILFRSYGSVFLWHQGAVATAYTRTRHKLGSRGVQLQPQCLRGVCSSTTVVRDCTWQEKSLVGGGAASVSVWGVCPWPSTPAQGFTPPPPPPLFRLISAPLFTPI